ncbi:MAG: DUF116 domain-containing protein, partial [Candidatus Cloacimonetes bacterium]|nr:DUF116 domain-containing protein [Candidatus Cloacimonadota bacterium]
MTPPLETSNKQIFLRFALFGLLLIIIFTGLLYWLVLPRLETYNHVVSKIIFWTLLLFDVVLLVGYILITLSSFTKRNSFFAAFAVKVTIRFLFPMTVILGYVFGYSRNRIQESFVHLNNAFIRSMKTRLKPDEVLILLPHCLQHTDCNIRIIHDVNKCVGCGKCDIGAIKEIGQEFGVNVSIATGGTLARRIIKKHRPKFIIAVACHRDLADGIRDVYPIPIMGILNTRPEGPCINTRVAVEQLRKVLAVV